VTRGTNAIGSAVIGIKPGVVESCARPAARGVAKRTRCGEASRDVVGTIGCLVLRLMAAITIGGQRRVIVVHVTIGARDLGMKAGKRKRSVVMVKAGRRPRGGAMADVTLLRKPSRDMARIVRILIIRQMATHTCSTGESKIPIRMTLAALHGRVKTSEWPTRRRVIEGSRGPVRGAVAHFALLRETRRDVTRVVCTLEIFQVTAHARGGAEVEVPVHVAERTLHLLVRPG
jgi:hypothetical protein